eukprot:gene9505-biopygen9262
MRGIWRSQVRGLAQKARVWRPKARDLARKSEGSGRAGGRAGGRGWWGAGSAIAGWVGLDQVGPGRVILRSNAMHAITGRSRK